MCRAGRRPCGRAPPQGRNWHRPGMLHPARPGKNRRPSAGPAVTASKTGFHMSVVAGSLTVAPVTGVIRLAVTVKGTFPRPCGGHHRVLRTTHRPPSVTMGITAETTATRTYRRIFTPRLLTEPSGRARRLTDMRRPRHKSPHDASRADRGRVRASELGPGTITRRELCARASRSGSSDIGPDRA
jgi:hypothetical protein